MPVVMLPGAEAPTALPPNKLKAIVDQGQRVVLPDFDVAIKRRERPMHDTAGGSLPVYLVEPLDADYVEEGVQDATVDNTEFAEEFATFEEALEAATDQ